VATEDRAHVFVAKELPEGETGPVWVHCFSDFADGSPDVWGCQVARFDLRVIRRSDRVWVWSCPQIGIHGEPVGALPLEEVCTEVLARLHRLVVVEAARLRDIASVLARYVEGPKELQ